MSLFKRGSTFRSAKNNWMPSFMLLQFKFSCLVSDTMMKTYLWILSSILWEVITERWILLPSYDFPAAFTCEGTGRFPACHKGLPEFRGSSRQGPAVKWTKEEKVNQTEQVERSLANQRGTELWLIHPVGVQRWDKSSNSLKRGGLIQKG